MFLTTKIRNLIFLLVGCLTGDAVLHLVPTIFGLSHSHGEDKDMHLEHDHHGSRVDNLTRAGSHRKLRCGVLVSQMADSCINQKINQL